MKIFKKAMDLILKKEYILINEVDKPQKVLKKTKNKKQKDKYNRYYDIN